MEKHDTPQAQRDDILFGRNAVAEALRAGRPIECIYIQQERPTGSLAVIAARAKQQGLPLKVADPHKLESLAQGGSHQGVVAVCAAKAYCTLEELLAAIPPETPPFLIVADHIEDPHNLGAIIRSAEAAGAHGLVLPKRGSAGLTATVAKVSAGALEHLQVARVANIAATVQQLKKQNMWCYCLEAGGQSWQQVNFAGGVALVVGAEGTGVSRVVRSNCDEVVSLPMLGRVTSLNASVAAGIVMYEVVRQRLAGR